MVSSKQCTMARYTAIYTGPQSTSLNGRLPRPQCQQITILKGNFMKRVTDPITFTERGLTRSLKAKHTLRVLPLHKLTENVK